MTLPAIRADLLRVAQRVLRDPAAAEDVVQDALVKLLDQQEPIDRADRWLKRVVRNLAIDQIRARRPAGADPDELPDPSDPVDGDTDRVASWLPGLLEQVPEPYRSAVRAVDLEGVSQAQLAQQLGLSTSGARTRVQRGRKLLHERLLACCAVRFEGGDVVDTGSCSRC